MRANGKAVRVFVSVATLAALLMPASTAQAWGGWGGGGDRDHRDKGRDFDRDHGRDHHDWEWYYTPHYFPRGHVISALPRGFMRIILGGLEYYYLEGSFYRMDANQYVVVPAPVGAVVTAIPTGCQPVIIDGVPYYLINGNTYVPTTVGYQVVPPPNVVVVQTPPPVVQAPIIVNAPVTNAQPPAAPAAAPAAPADDNVFTVNIPNSKGGYTAVTLTRSGNGFIGPQGEYYTEFPRIEQLKVMYGK